MRTVESITELQPAEWDRLVTDDNFYHSHSWLLSLEYLHGPHLIVVACQKGELVGALPVWGGEHGEPGLFDLPDQFSDVPGEWDSHFLWLGAHRSVSNGLLVSTHARRPDAVLRALLDHAHGLAAERRLAGVVMPYVPAPAADELASSHPEAYALLHSADAEMEVPPGGLGEWLEGLSRKDRLKRRAELRKFHAAGNTVTWVPVDDPVAGDAARLIAQNRSRYGSDQGADWMHRSFDAQRRSGVLDQAIAGVCRRDGRTIAVLVCYGFRGHLYARYFGFDYAAARPASEYHVLVYSLALDFAAQHEFHHYHLSTSALDIKARRGAVLTPQAAVVAPTENEWPPEKAVETHNERYATTFWRRFQHRRDAISSHWNRWFPRRRPRDK
ncbi:peptidogalycan biosysnthesis protein [Nonomuraea solani]|uniref:peptidogalycan biosysnthesis protein n=1 Tax=Nonomuraea solani TaxID=1144553 RepID=UPI001358C1B1|nr:peptidogalycan biosysnthesis protein [Nonomuraea solani]